jgi:hypothetical protein
VLRPYRPLMPRILCRDGVTLSVQVGRSHYCSPRDDDGPYSKVEVGFISDNNGLPVTPPETWRGYADGEFPSSVYGYVPVDLVLEFIKFHGGSSSLAAKFLERMT